MKRIILLSLIVFTACNRNTEQKPKSFSEIESEKQKEVKQELPKIEYSDILKDVKKIISNKKINEYDTKVTEATISNTGVISLNLKLNGLTFNVLTGMGASGDGTLALMTLDLIFKSAGPFFNKFAEAKTITYDYSETVEKRDKYGNLTGNEKNSLIKATLHKSTYEKINIEYAKKELFKSTVINNDWKKFADMLDEFWINSK